jgi:hypothetical protein
MKISEKNRSECVGPLVQLVNTSMGRLIPEKTRACICEAFRDFKWLEDYFKRELHLKNSDNLQMCMISLLNQFEVCLRIVDSKQHDEWRLCLFKIMTQSRNGLVYLFCEN